jgi:site-specific recombinase XerD
MSGGEARFALGDPRVDSYLVFVAGRARANTLRAVAHDLKAFFGVVGKDPAEVVAADVFDFLDHQRGDRTVVRISDGESGLSARTIARRLSSISGFYSYLVARGDTPVRANPVPRGLSTCRRGGRRQQVPLVRVPRTLPKILSPAEVNALIAALRTDRDRAHAHHHRAATMKVDTDILSIHRGLLLFVRGWVVKNPESGSTRFLTGSGGPAPSSHQICATS